MCPHQVDIWSSGMLMYYMLAGSLPFDGFMVTDHEMAERRRNLQVTAESAALECCTHTHAPRRNNCALPQMCALTHMLIHTLHWHCTA